MVKEEMTVGSSEAIQDRRGTKLWWLQDSINSLANLSYAHQLNGEITQAEAKQALQSFVKRLNIARKSPDYGGVTNATYAEVIAMAKRSKLQDISDVNALIAHIQQLTHI